MEDKRVLASMAAGAGAVLSVLLVLLLGLAWLKSGSVAVLSAMVDSVLDILISASNVLVIRYAYKPADKDHRFGHGKIEGVAALFQAAFISGSALFVALEALSRLRDPTPIASHGLAIGILLAVSLLTLALAWFQGYVQRATGSLAVEADRAHYIGDIAVNMGVIVSLGLDYFFQVSWLDPVVACVVVIWLVWTAYRIGGKSLDMLLDREVGGAVRGHVKKLIETVEGVDAYHDLRITRSGPSYRIIADLVMQPDLRLVEAHDIARAVEQALIAAYPLAQIVLHIDPVGDTDDTRHIGA